MAQSRFKKNQISAKKLILACLIGITVSLGVLFILEKTKITNFYEKKPATIDQTDKTTSTVPSAQEDFNDGGQRDTGNTIGENEGSGSVEDLMGNSSAQSNSDLWTSSSSGEIVVHSPVKSQELGNGSELSGTSSLMYVTYRLIDNVSGVIAEGQLSVVSGNFAGKVMFSTSATEGRLDVFGTKSDGSEFSNVEIPIKF